MILINVNSHNVMLKIENNIFKFYNINFNKCFNNQIIDDMQFLKY